MSEPTFTPYKSPSITTCVEEGTKNPRLPLGNAASVADVLRSSGRTVAPDVYQQSYPNFDKAIEFLVKTAGKYNVLSDILLIAAGQMYGERDPLDPGQSPTWKNQQDKFVTVLIPNKTIDFSVIGLKTQAVGYTDHLPAAVYVSTFAHEPIDPEVHLAQTLMHEYTHLAIMRTYRSASVPWGNDDEVHTAPDDRKKRRREMTDAFARITAEPNSLNRVQNDDLRKALTVLSQDWAGYKGERRDPESVPYLVEALFLAARFNEEPESIVRTAFGQEIMDTFTKHVVPDICKAAQKVREAGAVT